MTDLTSRAPGPCPRRRSTSRNTSRQIDVSDVDVSYPCGPVPAGRPTGRVSPRVSKCLRRSDLRIFTPEDEMCPYTPNGLRRSNKLKRREVRGCDTSRKIKGTFSLSSYLRNLGLRIGPRHPSRDSFTFGHKERGRSHLLFSRG